MLHWKAAHIKKGDGNVDVDDDEPPAAEARAQNKAVPTNITKHRTVVTAELNHYPGASPTKETKD